MAGFRRIDVIEELSPSFFFTEAPIIASKTTALSCEPRHRLTYELDLFRPSPLLSPATPCDFFDAFTADLIAYEQPPPFYDPFLFARFERRVAESHRLRDLSDRVSLLEFGFDRLLSDRSAADRGVDRKYKWTAEIKSPEEDGFDRKYKWSAEVKGAAAKSQSQSQQQKKKAATAKNYKWTAEMKGGKIQRTEAVEVKDRNGRVRNYKWSSEIEGKGGDDIPIQRTYTFQASTGADRTGADKEKKGMEEKKEKKKDEGDTRVVEIEDSPDQRALVLRQAFARRTRADLKRLGKRKELSPQDAAMVIQVTFRAYLIRRSQALRALRELAVAKAKLKEIRALFHNFSYRSSVARDAAERQRFTERIIVLLLTVDSIEGADIMVRSSKRSMVDELEAMLDVVDPHPQGRSLSMRRRTFDMPNGFVEKEMAAGVANVVQLVERDENGSATFEACL